MEREAGVQDVPIRGLHMALPAAVEDAVICMQGTQEMLPRGARGWGWGVGQRLELLLSRVQSSPLVLKINLLWFANEVTERTPCFLVRRMSGVEETISGSHFTPGQGRRGCRATRRAREVETCEHPGPPFRSSMYNVDRRQKKTAWL